MSNYQFGDRTTSGNINTQGDKTFTFGALPDSSPAPSSAAEEATTTGPDPATEPDPDLRRNVFVVHGRDNEVRDAMFDLLRKLDLQPLEWESLVRATKDATPYLGKVVLNAPKLAQVALVLLTPDDVVRLHPKLHGPYEPYFEAENVCQPRPNVLLELGMAMMAYPERTLIVEVGRLRPIADIAGLNVIRFDGTADAVGKIVERLKTAGAKVNDVGSAWRDLRPFATFDAYRRAPE
ncbi:MAG TPA: nucleotide-binding protein [Pseudonocardiaceae bacterium]|jgi:predicted nucleotide-binding protein|nr:nucleotide-binding protein [Pseudonocardiaceae bacterium]